MKTLFDEMEHAVKNWWLSLILGILYIIVALCCYSHREAVTLPSASSSAFRC